VKRRRDPEMENLRSGLLRSTLTETEAGVWTASLNAREDGFCEANRPSVLMFLCFNVLMFLCFNEFLFSCFNAFLLSYFQGIFYN